MASSSFNVDRIQADRLKQQAITWSNVDWSSVGSVGDIHIRKIS